MNVLEMKCISKKFGGAQALDNVDFSVRKGEIHALLGENGAGKSTLMNILAGVVEMDSGLIYFDGEKIIDQSIRKAEHMGIAFVHQELNVVNDLTVWENLFLCKELLHKSGVIDKKRMIREARRFFGELGVDLDPMKEVSTLKTSEKQLLEISKALYFNAKLLILDEPTTSLGNDEVEHLFEILRKQKQQGKSFIFISHKMPEIFAISDRFTVLRNGSVTAVGDISQFNAAELTTAMVGAKLSENDVYQPRALGEIILKVQNLSGQGFSNVNLEVRKGEILAITGLAGSGSSEFLQCLFGVLPMYGGRVFLRNCRMKFRSIGEAMRSSIGMLPTNRKENSVVPDMTILENMKLAEYTISKRRKPIISRKEERREYQMLKKMLGIKAESENDPIGSLSGGNQQKVFLARWINTDAELLILDNPTQGVDVGAKADIYKDILNLAASGKTIIFNSLETSEIQRIADRCVIFYEGRIIKIMDHSEITEQSVMMYSTNAVQMRGDEIRAF